MGYSGSRRYLIDDIGHFGLGLTVVYHQPAQEDTTSHRRLAAAFCVEGMVVGLMLVPTAGQEQPVLSGAPVGISGLLAPGDSSPLPTTPWGHPDLQGVWNGSTSTPLEHMTPQEQERERAALEPERHATAGTSAAWGERAGGLDRESLIVDPPDGRVPPMHPEAIQRLIGRENARRGRGEADSWFDRHSWERCISRTLPVAMTPSFYNANYQILQTPQHVVILIEMIHEARIIPLDGRRHVADGVRQWLGDGRGHWEGDTLVVETTRFNNRLDGGAYQPVNILKMGHRGPGGTLRLVEHFRLRDRNTIDYQFTVDDPKTFTRPYTVAIPLRRRDTSNSSNYLFEYACHEGNQAMMNVLKGARANEQASLDAAALASRSRIDAGHPGVEDPAVPFVR